jgi:hypothetical protein
MKSMMQIRLSLSILALLTLSGCGSESPDLQAQPIATTSGTQSGGKAEEVIEPKVDILFVVDNSGSMKDYQDKMAKNVELFANEFFDNARINYRIGVVPIWDSDYLNDKTVYRSGPRIMNPYAELVQLKGLPENEQRRLYITRETPNPKEVLKQTVVLGTQWGPEAEQSFSPVLGVIDPKINAEKNDNFYQSDAYLAVIFLTDADDVSLNLSGEDFYEQLKAAKDGDGSKILIATAIPRTCKSQDLPGPVKAFPDLINASGALVADLCSNTFGSQLARFGRFLAQRMAQRKVHLGFEPDIATLRVTHAPPGTPYEQRAHNVISPNDYKYDPSNNNVILLDPKYPMPADHVIYVDADIISDAKKRNGRTKPI